MSLSKVLYLASRYTRDVEVVGTVRRGPERLFKRLIRRQVTRRGSALILDRLWR